MKNVKEIMESVASVVLVDGNNGINVPTIFLEKFEDKLIIDEDIDISEEIANVKRNENDIDEWVYITESVRVDVDGDEYALYTNECGDLIGYSINAYNDLSNEEQDMLWEELM